MFLFSIGMFLPGPVEFNYSHFRHGSEFRDRVIVATSTQLPQTLIAEAVVVRLLATLDC